MTGSGEAQSGSVLRSKTVRALTTLQVIDYVLTVQRDKLWFREWMGCSQGHMTVNGKARSESYHYL